MGVGGQSALGWIGTGISAGGQYVQGQEQAQQDRGNAAVARAQAADALQRGGREAGLLRTRGSMVAAQQKVGYANSGVDASSGTPLATMADTRLMSELDAQTAKANAARAAWGYQMQANGMEKQATIDEERGKFGFYGTLLGGVGQAASLYGGR